ncbi:MAG: ferritin family protein [bacterium]|nr:ferritin family protein [bacterium]
MMDKKKAEALKRAIKMEKEGKKFYLQSAGKSKSRLAKQLFRQLAREEDLHARKVEEVYKKLQAEGSLEQWVTGVNEPSRLEKVFRESLVKKAVAQDSEIRALNFALGLEDKSVKFYEGLAQKTRVLPEKRFYLALSQEERGHYLKIMDSIEYLSAPEEWNRMKGGANLDGG